MDRQRFDSNDSEDSPSPRLVFTEPPTRTRRSSPDSSSRDVIQDGCSPLPFRPTGISNDDLLHPRPPLSRRLSTKMDDLVSLLDSSSQLSSMTSCYPTSSLATPPAAICSSNNDTDAKSNLPLENIECPRTVLSNNIAHTDPFGHAGRCTSDVEEESCPAPHGNGKMKYDDENYFEGTWQDRPKNGDGGKSIKNNDILTLEGASANSNDQRDGCTRNKF